MTNIIACLATFLHLAGFFIITDGQPYSFLPPLDPNVPQPKILNDGQVFRAQVGDTLLLPCSVRDLGPMILLWKKGTRVLTAGDMMVRRDDRIDLKGTDLQINSVDVEDGGNYSCEIEADAEYPVVITHTLEVLLPPQLKLDLTDSKIVVRADTTVALKCKATGNPPPKMDWRKRNDRLPGNAQITDQGMTLTMSHVSRHHSGLYECEANNGVGKAVRAEISLQVLYDPEVSAERSVVHGGLGEQADLSCLVYADPEPEVIWYRDTMRLDPNGKRYMESRGSRHTLIIRKVEREDLANYSCYANNQLGRDRAYITLRGNPNTPVFNSQVLSKSQTSYTISWITESYAPIEEYKLLYRKIPSSTSSSTGLDQDRRRSKDTSSASSSLQMARSHGGNPLMVPSSPSSSFSSSSSSSSSSFSSPSSPLSASSNTGVIGTHEVTHAWHNLRLPPREMIPGGPKNNLYQEAYSLGPLLPDSSYEAKVSAKNRFGWSQTSETFQFYTQGKGTSPHQNFVKKPEIQDLGLSSSAAVDSIHSGASSSSSSSASASSLFSSRHVVLGSRILPLPLGSLGGFQAVFCQMITLLTVISFK
ncbi:brother of CDO-like [Tigriopus californicus]|uniref:brother of CDO-like n=1 Tax=Tigriopus californicus TaxID=6832 RepID=UPI0027D9DAD6|nr:brother of CDO-like [Tigriopus californicus]